MRLSNLLRNVDIVSCTADLSMEIDNICYDSRTANKGSAYVAVKRPTTDGHEYIASAIKNGAAVVIAERPIDDIACVTVKNGCEALAVISANLYDNPADKMTIIGITGTKGKTTAAFLIKHMLEKTIDAKVGLIGTVCNMAGDEVLCESKNTTPEAPEFQKLLSEMYDKGCTHAVMEVSSIGLAFDRLTNIEFKVGIFTNLSQDHLDIHHTMQEYLEAKSKLFNISEIGVINIDDPASGYIMENTGARKLTFAVKSEKADIRATCVKLLGADGIKYKINDKIDVFVPIPGMFTVYNTLSALSCAYALGIPLSDAAKSLEDVCGVPGRIETVKTDTNYKVIVDYAHSPDSVAKVLEAVHEFTKGKIISVLGCGGNRDKTKRPKMALAASKLSGYVVITTDNPRFEKPEDIIADMLPGICDTGCPYEVVTNREQAIHRAVDLAGEGDTVLIMGKGHENYQEVCGVRHHFDDREAVRTYLGESMRWKM